MATKLEPSVAVDESDAGDQLAMLRRMILIRRFDELALELIASERLPGVVHPYIGQESCAVGICSALEQGDRVFSNHRGHGHCLAAGIDLNKMMAELFGRATGCCKGKGGSIHMADIEAGVLGSNGIVGGGIPLAVGTALADVLHGERHVSVVFFGDGATGQGVFFESLNLAVLWKLPVLFVCENNGFASQTPFDLSLPANVARVVEGHQISAETVDGRELLEVRDRARHAVAAIRAGKGPYLLECLLDRWGAHSVVPWLSRDTRDPAYISSLRERDPIASYAAHLTEQGMLTDSALQKMRDEVEAELMSALEFAESSPYPEVATALEGVFA